MTGPLGADTHMLHPYLTWTEIQNTAAMTVNKTLGQPTLDPLSTHIQNYPNISIWHLHTISIVIQ